MRYVILLLAFAGSALALSGCDTSSTAQQPIANQIEETPALPENPASTPTPAETKENPKPVTSAPVPAEAAKDPVAAPTATINLNVPFTSQAPTGEWDDEHQQDGCEEASALMAMLWVQGKSSISASEARNQIVAISDYEEKTYGEFRDVSLEDMKKWIFNDYFKYNKVQVKMNITASDIVKELQAGHVVLAPMNGQKLGNPYFTAPGPLRHFLLIRGYDPAKKQFITNDPGTKRGQNYRYSEATIMNAIIAYPTGHHEAADENKKGILVVSK